MKRELPKRLHFKDGGYYYVRLNRWTHVGGNLDQALTNYRRIEHGLRINKRWLPAWFDMERYIAQTFWRARRNARNRAIPFDLTRAEFDEIAKRAAGKCEVTGITFELRVRPGSERRPFAPSLDRIDARLPYSLG